MVCWDPRVGKAIEGGKGCEDLGEMRFKELLRFFASVMKYI